MTADEKNKIARLRKNGMGCHYKNPDTGETHVFFSRYLYFDPSDMFTAKEVPVYLDRTNEKTAFVDIDAVLPKVVLHIADGTFLVVFSERGIKDTENQFSRDNIVTIILQKHLSFAIDSS